MAGGSYPGMPFNQQMSFPVELSLRSTPQGIRLHREPVAEISLLHREQRSWRDIEIRPGKNALEGTRGELLDIEAEIELGAATTVGFTVRGERVFYDASTQRLTCLGREAPLTAAAGRLHLRLLLDRTSLEVFGNHGAISMPICFLPDPDDTEVRIGAVGGKARAASVNVAWLRSAWE
jgi:sucrose-6-phosphate hydrolase SacC (GH32 family)